MATTEGARAIGQPEIGSIEVGKRADLITIEARQPHLAPLFDPVKALVYSARGGDVRDAVIDGRVVMRDRKVLTVDEDALLVRGRAGGAPLRGPCGHWPAERAGHADADPCLSCSP